MRFPGEREYIRRVLNHELKFGNVAYWDGRVMVYPHAQWLYDHRVYGYGYRGFTSNYAFQILRRFGKAHRGTR